MSLAAPATQVAVDMPSSQYKMGATQVKADPGPEVQTFAMSREPSPSKQDEDFHGLDLQHSYTHLGAPLGQGKNVATYVASRTILPILNFVEVVQDHLPLIPTKPVQVLSLQLARLPRPQLLFCFPVTFGLSRIPAGGHRRRSHRT